jgi:hypothetical protein
MAVGRGTALVALLALSAGCTSLTRTTELHTHEQDGLEFESWIEPSDGIRVVHVDMTSIEPEAKLLQGAELFLFEDDGDGTYEESEKRAWFEASLDTDSSRLAFASWRLAPDSTRPWVLARVRTSAGEVRSAWPLTD